MTAAAAAAAAATMTECCCDAPQSLSVTDIGLMSLVHLSVQLGQNNFSVSHIPHIILCV